MLQVRKSSFCGISSIVFQCCFMFYEWNTVQVGGVSKKSWDWLPSHHYGKSCINYHDDDDDKLFCGMVDQRKAFGQPGPSSEILTIASLQHAASRVWTCTESEFRLSWMKLCSSDNHYTTAPNTLYFMEVVSYFLGNCIFYRSCFSSCQKCWDLWPLETRKY